MSRITRIAILTSVYTLAIGVFFLFSLTGPTLLFVAPILTFSSAGLISGTYQWLDRQERRPQSKAPSQATVLRGAIAR